MSEQYKKSGDSLTDPQVHMGWREFEDFFGHQEDSKEKYLDKHLTNYQDIIVRLHGTWDSNKSMAEANSLLILKMRKMIKKAKKALRGE